jgi:hypothetical protein
MSTTTYSIGRVIAHALRKTTFKEEGADRWLTPLQDGRGSRDDMVVAIWELERVGKDHFANELRAMLVPALEVGPTDMEMAQSRMQRASAALEEALSACDGKSANDAEATGLLLCAVAEHSRALAALFAAHMEACR